MARARTSRAQGQPLLAQSVKHKPKKRPSKGKTVEKSSKPSKTLDAYTYEAQMSRRDRRRAQSALTEEERVPNRRPKSGGKGRNDEDEEEDGSDEEPEIGFRFGNESGSENENLIGEDEEIDSDEADEDFDGPKSKAKQSKKVAKVKPSTSSKRVTFEVNLDEDEDDRMRKGSLSEADDDEFMDLSEMLDRTDTPTDSSASGGEDETDEEDDTASDDDADMASDLDEEDDADALDRLDSFIEALPSKRKAELETNAEPRKRRRVLEEKGEAWEEGTFGSLAAREGQGKITIEDLLADLPAAQGAALRKSLKPLVPASTTGDDPERSVSALKRRGPLPPPLSSVQQAKIDRQAAAEKLGHDLTEWHESSKLMKGIGKSEADGEHRLVLPLGRSSGAEPKITGSELQSKFAPTNDLERSIQYLLAASQLTSKGIAATESSTLAALPPAEAVSRRAEMRHSRELMFRAERKAARVAKIKSKAYRRVQRRSRLKEAAEDGMGSLTVEQMAELDAIDNGERAMVERERLEVRRALERATLRHASKNAGGGQWARSIGGLQGLEEDDREALDDRATLEEQLRRKILGRDDDEESSSSEEGDPNDLEQIKNSAFDELAAFDLSEAAKADAIDGPSRGLLGMKFMKRAMAAKEARSNALASELRDELNGLDDNSHVQDVIDLEDAPSSHNKVDGNVGRFVFGPTSGQQSVELPSVDPSPSSKGSTEHKTKLNGHLVIDVPPAALSAPKSSRGPSLSESEAAKNPWLALGDASTTQSRKKNVVVDKDSGTATKSAARLKKRRFRTKEAIQADQDEAEVVIDVTKTLQLPMLQNVSKANAGGAKKGGVAATNGASSSKVAEADTSDDDSGSEADEPQPVRRGRAAMRQRDLVARAFADDNVVAEFAAEKEREIEADAPHDLDITLPGWGSWVGKGIKKSKSKPKFTKHVPGIIPTARQDAKYSHVIINEKRDRKSVKYLVKDLPFPYTNAAQHEHALRRPLGPEWTTATTQRAATTPAILVRPGSVVRPIQKGDVTAAA